MTPESPCLHIGSAYHYELKSTKELDSKKIDGKTIDHRLPQNILLSDAETMNKNADSEENKYNNHTLPPY